MPSYAGKLSPASSIRNFGGVSYTSSDLNQNPNGCIEDINWDLTSQGSLIFRAGWNQLCDFTDEAGLDGLFIFVTSTGTEQRFAISNGKVWSVVGSVKTQLTATGVTITPGTRWRGVQWKDKIWLANGLNQPIVIIPGSPAIVKTMAQVSADANSTVNKTPSEWSGNPPNGFTVVNRGQDERMFAWNNTKVYFCNLSDPTDWLATGAAGAGAFIVNAADGDNVTAVVGKFGYTVVFTTERTLIYTGDGPGDATTPGIGLEHMLEIGCPAGYDSVIQVGTDTYFWSNFGPANLIRLLNATELSTNLVGLPVQPHSMWETNRSKWTAITGYHDILRRRVVWLAPLAGSTTLNTAYVYQYDIKSWYRYEGWNAECSVASADGSIFAGMKRGSSHYFVQLHVGTADGPDDITAVYQCVPYDWQQPDMTKTCPFVDIFSRNDINNLSMTYNYDFGQISDVEKLTQILEGGEWGANDADPNPDVAFWGPGPDFLVGTWNGDQSVHIDRVDVYGNGKFLGLTFTAVGHGSTEILGWKTSPRVKGLR